MNKDILLSSNHDLAIIDFDLKLTDETNVVAQRVKRALLLFKGEYFLDSEIGMPYYDDILGTKNSIDTIQAIFINAIREVKGVADIKEFNIAFDDPTRTLTINMNIKDNLDNEIEISI